MQNAEPYEEAKTVVIESIDNKYPIPIEEAKELILCFSSNGKPLKEDGPIHVYFGDGSNRHNPIKNVRNFALNNNYLKRKRKPVLSLPFSLLTINLQLIGLDRIALP